MMVMTTKAGKHHSQGGGNSSWDPPLTVADKNRCVDGDDARSALSDGKVVSDFLLCDPALFLHHLPLEDGQHGVATAEGTYSHLGKGQKQVQIKVQQINVLSINFSAKCGPPGPTPAVPRPRRPADRESSYSRPSNSSSHSAATASLGIRQSPRGDRVTEPTLGPSGRQERLNCWVKNRR